MSRGVQQSHYVICTYIPAPFQLSHLSSSIFCLQHSYREVGILLLYLAVGVCVFSGIAYTAEYEEVKSDVFLWRHLSLLNTCFYSFTSSFLTSPRELLFLPQSVCWQDYIKNLRTDFHGIWWIKQ